jgi:hypothetical protein
VVGLQGEGRGQAPGDVHHHEGRAPAGHGVEHFHGVEQTLAGGGGEDPNPGGGRGPGGGEHGMLGLHGHHAAVQVAGVDPMGDGFDDLRLGGDGEGRDIIHPASRAPQAAAPLPVSKRRVMIFLL